MSDFLSKERITASLDYNRWLVPPAALAIHLCIGQIYAYSVFNVPLSRVVGITESVPEDWKISSIGWIFSIALFCLGASAAIFGKWVDRNGPRMAMFSAALCFSGGFFISAMGVHFHQLWLVYLGNGVLGGLGLGLGYISPVSTLIKWFPDRPGLATGMAIMGFGGGAMIASPLSVEFMEYFSSKTSTGLVPTFILLGLIYLIFMSFGALIVRIPHPNWSPSGHVDSKIKETGLGVEAAVRSTQFYLLFAVLLLNVTAGIGVLGQASLMIREMFSSGKKLIGAAEAAGFVGLLSLFNMLGRFFWSSLSDKIGRRNTYNAFFILGALLYFAIPQLGEQQALVGFIVSFAIIISMYGGGFATIPAYLRDVFGTKEIGAIHGRLLLAWSLAALIGPVTINYLREYQIEELALPASQAYSITMYIMAGLLVIGLMVNNQIKSTLK
jgi:MFS family permease